MTLSLRLRKHTKLFVINIKKGGYNIGEYSILEKKLAKPNYFSFVLAGINIEFKSSNHDHSKSLGW